MSTLTDIERLETPGELRLEAGSRQIVFVPGNRIGVGTSAPTVDLEVVGNRAVRIPASVTADRPSSGRAGQLRVGTDTGLLEVHDGSAWLVHPMTSGAPWLYEQAMSLLAGSSSMTVDGLPANAYLVRIVLSGITTSDINAPVVLQVRTGGSDSGGSWTTMWYGTLGDGLRTLFQGRVTATGMQLVDGSNSQAASLSPLAGIVDLHGVPSGAGNIRITARMRGFAWSPGQTAPIAFHSVLGVSSPVAAVDGIRLYVGTGTFASGSMIVAAR